MSDDDAKRYEALQRAQEILAQAAEMVKIAEDIAQEHSLPIEFMGLKYQFNMPSRHYGFDDLRLLKPIWATDKDWDSSQAGCEPGTMFPDWPGTERIDNKTDEELDDEFAKLLASITRTRDE